MNGKYDWMEFYEAAVLETIPKSCLSALKPRKTQSDNA